MKMAILNLDSPFMGTTGAVIVCNASGKSIRSWGRLVASGEIFRGLFDLFNLFKDAQDAKVEKDI